MTTKAREVNQRAFLEGIAVEPDTAVGEGSFEPGPAVWVGKREVAHFTGADTLDIRLTRALIRASRAEFESDERLILRRNASDWAQVRMGSKGDEAFAAELVRAAIAANRASAKPGPPPEGAELERRRRFH